MGTFDGPGLRLVVFLQGCPFRCLYCANPDTIDAKGGTPTPPEEILQMAISQKVFFGKKGGITFSGGEPTLQAEALIPLFKDLKANGIHICLDTNGGIWNEKVEELVSLTDLVLLDLKEFNPERHKKLTGCSNAKTLHTAAWLEEQNRPFWLRYVLVPGYSDFEEDIRSLGEHLGQYKSIQRVEILPYHRLGVHKYEAMGWDYQLKEVKENIEVKPVEKEKIIITSMEELKTKPIVEESLEKETKTDIVDNEDYYRLPRFSEIFDPLKPKKNNNTSFTQSNKEILERVLKDFGIAAKVVEIHIGPAVTEYELTVPPATKVSRILNIDKEIALALAAKDVIIQAPIPGKSTIGIEIPNPTISSVTLREVLESPQNLKSDAKICSALGKDIMGTPKVFDLTKMPHLLVAGSTGSGKSVCINGIIASILMRYKPNEVKLVLVDPKKVELTNYNGIPHLLCPVVSDPKKASLTLQKVVTEMDNRFQTFSDKEVKNITGYNDMIEKYNKKHPESPQNKMPYIVVIIDELADLMLVASKEVEDSITRITQLARAAGIHLIVATQRPSTDVITGLIKNNIPSRIAFAVASQIDSRTILDQRGAERLLGKGDMLYFPMGESVPIRVQGCFINDDEIKRLIDYCKNQATAKYDSAFENVSQNTSSGVGNSAIGGEDDDAYNDVVEFAIQTGKISASLIQRRFRFGYNRAARMMDLLESRGIVGPQNGSKPREVLVKLEKNDVEE